MKVIMAMVMSIDGKITQGGDSVASKWASKEDQNYFFSLLRTHRLMIMGSNTYNVARDKIRLEKDRLRIVLTRHPEKYAKYSVPGKLEFSNKSPRQLVNFFQAKKYKTMLLIGGGTINSAFLAENLVDELYLTIEPKIFGRGKSLVGETKLNTNLKLVEMKKLNTQGTLLLHYKVL